MNFFFFKQTQNTKYKIEITKNYSSKLVMFRIIECLAGKDNKIANAVKAKTN